MVVSKRWFVITLSMFICASLLNVARSQIEWERRIEIVIPDFALEYTAEQEAKIVDLGERRASLIRNLQSQLKRDALTRWQKAVVIHALSAQFDVTATSDFIRLIDMKLVHDPNSKLVITWEPSIFTSEYPAVEALVKLQNYGVEEVLRSLPKEKKPLRRKLMFDVIEQVDGPKIGRMVFDRRIERIQKDNQRKPLKDYVPFLEEIKALQAAKAEFEKQFPLPPS